MKKAFTLIELVVAIAILVLVTSFAGAIFKVSIGSHRTGLANAEIMQRLRAITDQFNRDFKGIRQDAPMAIQFWRDIVDGTRRDSIAFFANGDFQSVRQYERLDGRHTTVSGNVASIYYGPASDPNILARKQKILTSDTSLKVGPDPLGDPNEFLVDSLAVWRIDLNDVFVDWIAPPLVNPHFEEYLPLYMTDGVANFMIQIGEWNQVSETFIWFPDDSHFDSFDTDLVDGIFGFFYNAPLSEEIREELVDWHDWSANWPRAIKFTFTLYDSRGIIREYDPETGVMRPGRTFTHIVYIGD